MLPSLRAFLSQLIDYAGLFPPASLPLDAAIRNYAAYLSSPEAWMLARFICPAAHLRELEPVASLFSEEKPLAVSALGRKSTSHVDFLTGLRESLAAIRAFQNGQAAHVTVEMIEAPLPGGRPGDRVLFDAAAEIIESVGTPHLQPFYEAAPDQTLTATLDALAAHNVGRTPRAGFKLRTGGVTADAFPTTGQIASAIVACRERSVFMKCTAGLHHPVRRYDDSVQAKMHGFLNVFGAGLLAFAHPLSAADMQAILEDEDSAHFRFDESGFAWQSVHATTEQIAAGRQHALLSFGSCSFEEPREDLKALGWL